MIFSDYLYARSLSTVLVQKNNRNTIGALQPDPLVLRWRKLKHLKKQ